MSFPGDTDQLDARLRGAARGMRYPPTPDIAGRVRRRLASPARRPAAWPARLALAAALLLAALLAVPDLRAAAARLFQIGVVRIRVEPEPTAQPSTPAPAPTALPSPAAAAASVADLAGETTLAEAARLVDFPIALPSYPADLGPPDRVFLQELAGDALVLVWLEPDDPGQVRLTLHVLTSRVVAEKTLFADETSLLAETRVGDAPALWVRGPHLLITRRAGREDAEFRRLVPGDVLIWSVDELTYRLESKLELEEARRVAESLR